MHRMPASRIRSRTQIGIVGAGPAGLMLSHLLARAGHRLRRRRPAQPHGDRGHPPRRASSSRTRVRTARRHRRLRPGAPRRLPPRGHRAGASAARATGSTSEGLVGASAQLYPQTDVFIDLADARERDGGDVRFGVTDVSVVDDVTTIAPGPAVHRRRRARPHEIRCRLSWSAPTARAASAGGLVPEAARRQYFREYPFAWFGILCEAPPSAPELIYNHSDARLRADQPAHRDAAADVLPVRPRRGRRRLVRRPDLGGAAVPRAAPTATSSRRGRSPRGRCCPSAASSRSRCATAAWCSPAMPRTRCRRPAPRGSTWPSPTCGCSPRSSSGP